MSSTSFSAKLAPVMASLLLMLLPAARSQEADASATTEAAPPREVAESALEELFSFLPEVVAKYNQTAITAAEIKEALPPQLIVMVANGYTPQEDELRHLAIEVAQQLINEKILLENSAEAGYAPQLEEGRERVAEIEAKVGGEVFAAGLKHQGISREQLVEQVARQAAVSKWIEEQILPTIDLSDEHLKEVYEEHKEAMQTPEEVEVSHILVTVAPDADEAARKAAHDKAVQLREQIVAGADFAELAKAESDCPSAANGGELGVLRRGETLPQFSDAAFALEKDQLSDVVETRLGYHIIQSHGKTEARQIPFEEAADQLRNAVRQNELNKALQHIVSETRQNASVELLIPGE